tara:strand:- start:8343 stop:8666 length:324 start_codon:yes stop_codon:yes gene_type:complete
MKIKEIVSKWSWQIISILFVLLYFGKGCTHKKVSKIDKKLEEKTIILSNSIDSLSMELNKLKESTANKKEVTDIMEKVMLEYLIYEDDLDKGKTSLSQIKNKIEEND